MFLQMTNEKMLEIQSAAQAAAVDAVKAQIAKGLPNRGMNKQRHGAVVAYVANEMLESFTGEDPKTILRATFSGSLLNASQLRQDLEKSGVLVKETAIDTEYGV